MIDFALPPVVAVLVWWLGTGGVMLLDRLPRDSWRITLGIATATAGAALLCIVRSADNTSPAGAYAGFVCAVVVWGWHELTFLAGWITGPRRSACSAPGHWPTRLRESVQAILWHELGILAVLALIAALTWGHPNPVALWTFGLLWAMRLSAKLNLFLGGYHRFTGNILEINLHGLPGPVGNLFGDFKISHAQSRSDAVIRLNGRALLN